MATSEYNLGGSAFYLSAFSALILPQLYFGIRHRTWGFLVGMICGVTLEIVAYVARIQMNEGKQKFRMYLVCITIGPAFFSAAIYLCLARIITVYGTHLSLLQPRTVAISFMIADLVALALQSAGGAIAGGADPSNMDRGISIAQAGLAAHLISMAVYVALGCVFAWKSYARRIEWDDRFQNLHISRKFRAFLISQSVATCCIFIRTCYRVAELSEGFDSDLWNNETAFLVLEGAMVLIATIGLTITHPGVAFQGRWADADFNLIGKGAQHGKERDTRGSEQEDSMARHLPLNSL
ncbi:RTA1-domain-containing protein [Lojkania enalia]|uniref:RTA1-domain-containing protein n=1 Tax=Lojkania enalia TaxID=147567 RepID=A0A9P4NA76_9PLEO|nr:RTA1-domain-containing protein [Didymosphaeria enalia]